VGSLPGETKQSPGLRLGWEASDGWAGELAPVDGFGIIGGDCGRLGFSVRASEFAASGVRRPGSRLGRTVVIMESLLKRRENRTMMSGLSAIFY